jgi:glycosyltransferase involved in cell wall biosynthesis
MIDRSEFEQLERRVRALEQELSRRRSKPSFKARSDLWRFEQYPPRELKTPASYSQGSLNAGANMTVAIVTPSYNHADYIGETIESVLSQNVEALSYHVQDGASTDRTADILDSYAGRLTWDSQPDRGQTHAINLGFERVSGEIMAYLNSDDCLLPGTIAYVQNYFANNPNVDIVYGHRIFIDRYGLEVGRAVLPPHDSEAIKWADYIPQETMFWRRSVWDAVAPFDESFNFALDWDFILRAADKGFRFVRLPRFLGAFRVHDQQKTAALARAGELEMTRLREERLGRAPSRSEINAAISSYLRRQARYSLWYRLGLVQY